MRVRFFHIVGWSSVVLALLVCGWLAVGLSRPLDPIPRFGHDHDLVAITNVSVVDVLAGEMLGGQTVVIEENLISRIGDSDTLVVPAHAYRIDGSGRFLIPGLWDSHVHTMAHSPRLHFPLLIAHGITSIRNLGDGCSWSTDTNCVPDRDEWSAQGVNAGRMLPHSAVTASYHFEDASDIAESVRVVGELKRRGDTLIKLQLEDEVDPAIAQAIVYEAKRMGLPVAGHLPASIDLDNPAFEGIASIEHGDQLLDQCAMQAAKTRSTGTVEGCASLLATLAKRRTAFVPTFVASTGQDVLLGTRRLAEDEQRSFAPDVIALLWTVYRAIHVTGMDANDYEVARQRHEMAMELALHAHRSGVPVMVGTDALDPFVQHGASVHDELVLFVQAGFSNAEALRAATHVPAVVHGHSGTHGQVIVGARAELVLLRENPLEQIAATQTIEGVIKGGVYFDETELASLRSFAREQSNSHALNARLWWALLGG